MPVKIGFIGSSAPSSPHHDSFRRFIPKDLEFTFVQEAGVKTSLYDARGKVDALIGQVQELIAEHKLGRRDHQRRAERGAQSRHVGAGFWRIESSDIAGAQIVGCRAQSLRGQTHSPDDPGG